MDSVKQENNNFEDPFEGLSDEETAELLDVFFEDFSEKSERLSALIIELEEEPGNTRVVGELFQIYHSLKGTAGTFGFSQVSEIFHKLEFFVEDVRDGKLEVTPELIDLLLKTIDLFNKILLKIKSRRPTSKEEQALNEAIESFGRKMAPGRKPAVPISSQQEIIDRLKEEAEEFIRLKTSKIDTIIALSSELILRKRFDLVVIRGNLQRTGPVDEAALLALRDQCQSIGE